MIRRRGLELLELKAGLAPARVGLKARLLEPLCTGGFKHWGDRAFKSYSAGLQ